MKLLFGFMSDQLRGELDWEYAEMRPLGGAETALLRVASTFRELGHEVELLNYPRAASELRQAIAGKTCDVFVNSRLPMGILALDSPPGTVNYYWAHDDADQPLLDPLRNKAHWREAFYQRVNGLFLLSHYQRAAWLAQLGLVLEKAHLITNPIPYARFDPRASPLRERGPRAYYASTPYRGLRYLLDGWPLVTRLVPNAEVHVFSSLEVNGLPENDESRALFARAQSTPGVVYRGAVGQRQLREEARRCRVLAYPCSFPETSCIAAMEAMASGAVVVGTELGALPETAWKNPLQPLCEGWLERWAVDVARALTEDDHYEACATRNIELARQYDARSVVADMTRVFQRDLATAAKLSG